jgi:hypothetical protein
MVKPELVFEDGRRVEIQPIKNLQQHGFAESMRAAQVGQLFRIDTEDRIVYLTVSAVETK